MRWARAWHNSALLLSEIFLVLFSSWICQSSRLWRNYFEHYITGWEQEPVVDKLVVKLQHLSKAFKWWVISISVSASPGRQQRFEHWWMTTECCLPLALFFSCHSSLRWDMCLCCWILGCVFLGSHCMMLTCIVGILWLIEVMCTTESWSMGSQVMMPVVYNHMYVCAGR